MTDSISIADAASESSESIISLPVGTPDVDGRSETPYIPQLLSSQTLDEWLQYVKGIVNEQVIGSYQRLQATLQTEIDQFAVDFGQFVDNERETVKVKLGGNVGDDEISEDLNFAESDAADPEADVLDEIVEAKKLKVEVSPPENREAILDHQHLLGIFHSLLRIQQILFRKLIEGEEEF